MSYWGIKTRVQPTRHLRVILSVQRPLRKPLAGILSVGFGHHISRKTGANNWSEQGFSNCERHWPKEKKTERGYSRQAGKRLLSRGNKRVCSLLLLDMTRSNRLQLQKRRQILDLRKVLKITEH